MALEGEREHRRSASGGAPPGHLMEHRRSLSGGSAPLGVQMELRFVLLPEQSTKYDAVFDANSEHGVMSGARVRELLMKSELPKEELSGVWGLCKSERNLSPNLHKHEFRVAMHLVTLRLQGIPLPHALPACLQQHRDAKEAARPRSGSEVYAGPAGMSEPSPPRPGLAASARASTLPASVFDAALAAVPQQGSVRRTGYKAANPFRRQDTDGSLNAESSEGASSSTRLSAADADPEPQLPTGQASASTPRGSESSVGATTPRGVVDRDAFWATAPAQKAAFAACFGRVQEGGVADAGFVTRTEALQLFERVWRLCDLDRDGKLSASEFSRALVCASRLLEGRPLPTVQAAQLRREGQLQINGGARCHCVLERRALKLYTCDLLTETLESALRKPPQVAIPLDGTISFTKLDASQTSRPHVFLLTSKEPLKLTLDSFTRSTTEVDFQAPSEHLMDEWINDLRYVCADPCAAPAGAGAAAAAASSASWEAAISSDLSKTL